MALVRLRPDTTAPGLREAREKLKYDSMSCGERYAYDEHLTNVVIQEEAIGNAKWEGLVEGRAEGGKQVQLEIAHNLKKLSLPLETIIQATGLSVEEIESLK